MRRATRWLVALGALAALGAAAASIPARGGAPRVSLPDPAADAGTGESLIFVSAGRFVTRDAALDAAARFDFGDLQGFFAVPTADLEGVAAGEWLLASAFRTEAGAGAFERLARAAGVTTLQRIRAVYRGTAWIGLGLEERPDGTGPLVAPADPIP